MDNNKPTFADAKEGDKVYSLLHGEGIVGFRGTSVEYPLRVHFECYNDTFTLDGKANTIHAHPTLYWTKPEIIVPPRPKRKVEKTMDVWVNHYSDAFQPTIHPAEQAALRAIGIAGFNSNVQTVPGIVTYTIEE